MDTKPVRPWDRQLALFDEHVEVMRWLADGERISKIFGARVSAAVVAAKRAFFAETEHLDIFLAEMCENCIAGEDKRFFVGSTPLYAAYLEWATLKGFTAETQTAFGRHLSRLGIHARKSGHNGRKFRHGIRLKDVTQAAPLN